MSLLALGFFLLLHELIILSLLGKITKLLGRKPLGTTGFGLFFLLPIEFFRYPYLTHSHHTSGRPSILKANLLSPVHRDFHCP